MTLRVTDSRVHLETPQGNLGSLNPTLTTTDQDTSGVQGPYSDCKGLLSHRTMRKLSLQCVTHCVTLCHTTAPSTPPQKRAIVCHKAVSHFVTQLCATEDASAKQSRRFWNKRSTKVQWSTARACTRYARRLAEIAVPQQLLWLFLHFQKGSFTMRHKYAHFHGNRSSEAKLNDLFMILCTG